MTITAEDENGEKSILMTGIIAGFSFEPHPHASMLTLVLKSGTYLMDTAAHFRSFQNTGLTYQSVLDTITQFYDMAGGIGEECLKAAASDFLLQYKETDWIFVKRLASSFWINGYTRSCQGVGFLLCRKCASFDLSSACHCAVWRQ